MKITLTAVMVNDHARSLKFCPEVWGFQLHRDVPAGDARWLTVISPEGHSDLELLLEPTGHPASKIFQKALHDSGTPLTSFTSLVIRAEQERLTKQGIVFTMPPPRMGPAIFAVFDDTCGNLIGLAQET